MMWCSYNWRDVLWVYSFSMLIKKVITHRSRYNTFPVFFYKHIARKRIITILGTHLSSTHFSYSIKITKLTTRNLWWINYVSWLKTIIHYNTKIITRQLWTSICNNCLNLYLLLQKRVELDLDYVISIRKYNHRIFRDTILIMNIFVRVSN